MMASPQLENGYLKLANEVAEALARFRLPGRANQIVWAVIRMTYGYNRKKAPISLALYRSLTGLRDAHILQEISGLVDMKVIIQYKNKTRGGRNLVSEYEFNKDFESWRNKKKEPVQIKLVLPKEGVPIKGGPVLPVSVVPKVVDIKDNIINTNNKDISNIDINNTEILESNLPQLILDDLNQCLEKAGIKKRKPFKLTDATKRSIKARLKDFEVEDFVHVHRVMILKWKDDPEMKQYLTPDTLYRPSKFPKYAAMELPGQVDQLTGKEKESAANSIRWLQNKRSKDGTDQGTLPPGAAAGRALRVDNE